MTTLYLTHAKPRCSRCFGRGAVSTHGGRKRPCACSLLRIHDAAVHELRLRRSYSTPDADYAANLHQAIRAADIRAADRRIYERWLRAGAPRMAIFSRAHGVDYFVAHAAITRAKQAVALALVERGVYPPPAQIAAVV